MRRVIVFLSSLAAALMLCVGTAHADTVTAKGPLPATLKARAVSGEGAPGTLVPVQGTLLDANRQPLTGQSVVASVPGGDQQPAALTSSSGDFELYVPLPDDLPASGSVEVTLSYGGSAQAAASTMTLPVRIAVPTEGDVEQPGAEPAARAELGGEVATLPTSGSAMLDQLIAVAAGLLGVMLALFAVGAFLRRRRH